MSYDLRHLRRPGATADRRGLPPGADTGPLKTRESQSVGGLVLSALVMTSSGR